MRRELFAVLLAVLAHLAGCASSNGPSESAPTKDPEILFPEIPRDPGLHAFNLTVDGEIAPGSIAIPASGTSTQLVILCHPFGTPPRFYDEALAMLADRGALALAMDYRGGQADFKVDAGAADTVAATLAVQALHPAINLTILYGWSMGGEVSGMAVATAPPGTYDYWLDGSGALDLVEVWAAVPVLQPVIEHETGGNPVDVPGEFSRRSPIERVDEIARHGLRRVYMVYGAADGITPIDQAERMFQRLEEAGVPVTFYTVPTDAAPWVCVYPAFACAPEPPVGPASHEVGDLPLMMPLLLERLDGVPDAPGPAVRAVYEGITGTRTE